MRTVEQNISSAPGIYFQIPYQCHNYRYCRSKGMGWGGLAVGGWEPTVLASKLGVNLINASWIRWLHPTCSEVRNSKMERMLEPSRYRKNSCLLEFLVWKGKCLRLLEHRENSFQPNHRKVICFRRTLLWGWSGLRASYFDLCNRIIHQFLWGPNTTFLTSFKFTTILKRVVDCDTLRYGTVYHIIFTYIQLLHTMKFLTSLLIFAYMYMNHHDENKPREIHSKC